MDLDEFLAENNFRNPPGYRANVYTHGDIYILQFAETKDDLSRTSILTIQPQRFEFLCSSEPIIVTIIDYGNCEVYVSKYPKEPALEKFVKDFEEILKSNGDKGYL